MRVPIVQMTPHGDAIASGVAILKSIVHIRALVGARDANHPKALDRNHNVVVIQRFFGLL